MAAVFVDFPKNKCNFLHKTKLDIVRRVQLLTGRRLMRSFSIGAVPTAAPRSRRLWPAPTQPASVMNCLCVISFLHSLSLSFLPARLYASAGTIAIAAVSLSVSQVSAFEVTTFRSYTNLFIIFWTPVLSSQRNEKITLCNTKSTKIKLQWTLLLLLHKTVMQ